MSNPPTSSQDTVKPSSQPLSETTTNPLSKDLTENNLLSVWEKIRALYEQRFKPSSSPRHDLHSSPVSDDGSTQQNSSDISSSTRSSETESKSTSGWRRVWAMYKEGAPYTMERYLSEQTLEMSFMSGMFVGGMLGIPETQRRAETHAVGQHFGSRGASMRRQADYIIMMSLKNGFIGGVKMITLVGSFVCLTTHLAVYRDHFSLLYFPLSAAVSSFLFGMPHGRLGIVSTFKLGMIPVGIVATLPVIYYRYHGLESIDAGYKHFKRSFEEELKKEEELNNRLRQIMRDEKLYLRSTAKRRLEEIKQEAKENGNPWKDELEYLDD
ncbi:hypothetical protein DdX_08831 [Ditylenchus destructor]|uniref:Complex I assembly factor TIMMDC1, mitochondrial n=1 Tax=Ditylenchus destructor TaxID=166010 RepID=A0AAD4R739_9BILA|nr:hypothetical protein DdX_08831 [Ditylenchus destructor]